MEIGRGEGTVLVCMSSVMGRAVSCITVYGLSWLGLDPGVITTPCLGTSVAVL